MKLFNELPVVLPVYTDIRNQNRHKENVKTNCEVFLLSPSDAILPFVLKLPKDSSVPSSWKLYSLNGQEFADISNNIPLLKAVNFEDFAFAYYNGEKLRFKHETIEQDLNVCGTFYFVIKIDNKDYFSEVFQMVPDIKQNQSGNKYLKFTFWDEVDVEPVRYRKNFKQILYLDTFIHASETNVEEETEPDGFDNEIPTFQKLTIKQRIAIVVPDFMKTAIQTIQLHNNIEINENNKRSGIVDRFKVTATSEENGSLASLDIVLETDVLTKTNCNENKTIISDIWV